MNYTLICSGLYIELTSYCNRKCPYCYNDSKAGGVFLDKKYVFALIDECNNFLKQMTLSGGEPFYHPHIDEIISYANSRNIKLTLITNLSILKMQRAIEILKEGHLLQITLDSIYKEKNDATRGKGSYTLVRNLLNLANKENIQNGIILRLNFSKSNIDEITSFVKFAKSYRLKTIDISTIAKIGRGFDYLDAFDYENDIVEIASILKKLEVVKAKENDINISFSHLDRQVGCVLFGEGNISIGPRIDPNGDVFPCQLFSGIEHSFGSIKQYSLHKILNSKKAFEVVNRIRDRKKVNADCKLCPFTDACMCGCPAVSSSQTGNILEKYDQCRMIKFFMKERLKEIKKDELSQYY